MDETYRLRMVMVAQGYSEAEIEAACESLKKRIAEVNAFFDRLTEKLLAAGV